MTDLETKAIQFATTAASGHRMIFAAVHEVFHENGPSQKDLRKWTKISCDTAFTAFRDQADCELGRHSEIEKLFRDTYVRIFNGQPIHTHHHEPERRRSDTPGQRIRAARERAGLTQAELARRLSTTPACVHQVEAASPRVPGGKPRVPSLEWLIRCADALGVPRSELSAELADKPSA